LADRTGAFLAQITAFLDNDFTGEIVVHCQKGRILEMQLKQRIRVDEQSSSQNSALLQPSSTLTAVVGRP
jgi:hypothetical protein